MTRAPLAEMSRSVTSSDDVPLLKTHAPGEGAGCEGTALIGEGPACRHDGA